MRDLNKSIPGAPNFLYKEFVRSEVAIRKGIVNVPNEDQWKCIETLASNVLQPLRNEFGPIRISSGFRSIPLCKAIGSTKYSNHARGQAADIEPLRKGVTLIDLMTFIYEELEFRTLIAEYFDSLGWVHVDYRHDSNIRRVKLKDNRHNYTNISLSKLKSMYS